MIAASAMAAINPSQFIEERRRCKARHISSSLAEIKMSLQQFRSRHMQRERDGKTPEVKR